MFHHGFSPPTGFPRLGSACNSAKSCPEVRQSTVSLASDVLRTGNIVVRIEPRLGAGATLDQSRLNLGSKSAACTWRSASRGGHHPFDLGDDLAQVDRLGQHLG